MIKILVNSYTSGGCGKFRVNDPHQTLQELFKDEVLVTFNENINYKDEHYLQQFDLIFFHKLPYFNYISEEELYDKMLMDIKLMFLRLKRLNIKVVVDIDDYWRGLTNNQILIECVLECLRSANLVITPVESLALEVKKLNKNVVIIPNAINPLEEQFINKQTDNELLRFGWLGGSSHIEDIKLLSSICNTNKYQMVLCGFDLRGDMKIHIDKGVVSRSILPSETVWGTYERIFTNNYQNINKDYLEYLNEFEYEHNYNDKFESYRRIWTKPIESYASGYDEFDVSLIPLKDTHFNLYKSQLKIIEAGFKHKPIICSNFGPYKIDLIKYNRQDNILDGNALIVDKPKQWLQNAKLLENKDMRIELGERLYQTVKDKYDLRNVSKLRMEIYKKLLNE